MEILFLYDIEKHLSQCFSKTETTRKNWRKCKHYWYFFQKREISSLSCSRFRKKIRSIYCIISWFIHMHIIKVRGVILREGSIFLMRDPEKHFYYLPWWTLEKQETFTECLCREIVEETGIIPVVWEPLCVREFKTENGLNVDIWCSIHNSEDFLVIQKSNTTHGFEYYDEGFYSWDELKWKDVRPENLREILENQPSISIVS